MVFNTVNLDRDLNAEATGLTRRPRKAVRVPRLTQALRRTLGNRQFLRGAASVIVGLLLWEAFTLVFGLNPLLVSPPSAIYGALVQLGASGDLWKHVSLSLTQFLYGFIACAAISIPFGLALGMSRTLKDIFNPWISALYATPSIALAPVLILWLGFGITAKAAIVGFVAFFPIVINTMAGVESLPEQYGDVADAFGANAGERFRHVLLPGSLPFIFAGLRLAVGRGLVGLVIGDLFGSNAGLGYLILHAAELLNTPMLFAAVVMLALLAITLMGTITAIESKLTPWRWREEGD